MGRPRCVDLYVSLGRSWLLQTSDQFCDSPKQSLELLDAHMVIIPVAEQSPDHGLVIDGSWPCVGVPDGSQSGI